MQRLKLSIGNLVIVSEFRPDGQPHPHAGKTGVITRLLLPDEEERENLSSEEPKFGMVKLDDGIPPKNFICVSLDCLDTLMKWGRPKSFTARNPIPRGSAEKSKMLYDTAMKIMATWVNTMTEGPRELKKCSFCGRAEWHPTNPMFSSASASICLNCIRRYCLPYLRETEQRRVLHQARALCVPPSRWKKISNG